MVLVLYCSQLFTLCWNYLERQLVYLELEIMSLIDVNAKTRRYLVLELNLLHVSNYT